MSEIINNCSTIDHNLTTETYFELSQILIWLEDHLNCPLLPRY